MMCTRKYRLTGRDFEILKTLVLFCLQSYFKLYFEIKVKHYLVHGPNHVLTQLRILKSLSMDMLDIVTPYIRTGAQCGEKSTHTHQLGVGKLFF